MIIVEHTADYFQDQMKQTMMAMRFIIPVPSRTYLLTLLQTYTHQDIGSTPVVFDMINATAATTIQRLHHFKTMGDRSLMIAGVWPTSLSRKSVGVDYYIKMGRMGYSSVAAILNSRIANEHFAEMYSDLNKNFDKYCVILGKVVGACVAPKCGGKVV